jgi:ubiquitin carboxyl-terminal hydrolase 7
MLRTGTMGAVVDALLPKIKRPLDSVHGLRIFAVMNGKYLREYKLSDPISTAHDMLSMYVEEIPKEELELGGDEILLPCFHFQSDVNRMHGIPFRIVVKDVRENANYKGTRRNGVFLDV